MLLKKDYDVLYKMMSKFRDNFEQYFTYLDISGYPKSVTISNSVEFDQNSIIIDVDSDKLFEFMDNDLMKVSITVADTNTYLIKGVLEFCCIITQTNCRCKIVDISFFNK